MANPRLRKWLSLGLVPATVATGGAGLAACSGGDGSATPETSTTPTSGIFHAPAKPGSTTTTRSLDNTPTPPESSCVEVHAQNGAAIQAAIDKNWTAEQVLANQSAILDLDDDDASNARQYAGDRVMVAGQIIAGAITDGGVVLAVRRNSSSDVEYVILPQKVIKLADKTPLTELPNNIPSLTSVGGFIIALGSQVKNEPLVVDQNGYGLAPNAGDPIQSSANSIFKAPELAGKVWLDAVGVLDAMGTLSPGSKQPITKSSARSYNAASIACGQSKEGPVLPITRGLEKVSPEMAMAPLPEPSTSTTTTTNGSGKAISNGGGNLGYQGLGPQRKPSRVSSLSL